MKAFGDAYDHLDWNRDTRHYMFSLIPGLPNSFIPDRNSWRVGIFEDGQIRTSEEGKLPVVVLYGIYRCSFV
jgi:hypothetical protein